MCILTGRKRLYVLGVVILLLAVIAFYFFKKTTLSDQPPNTIKPVDTQIYAMDLRPIPPRELLADYPQYVKKIAGQTRYESNVLVNDCRADIQVRAWRYSYNARAIIEIPNNLAGRKTALVVVHPWGVEEEQGLMTSEPSGVTFFSTPQKNLFYQQHLKEVLNPFINKMRKNVALVAFSLPGPEDGLRKYVYRSIDNNNIDDTKGKDAFNRLKSQNSFVGGQIKDQIELLRGNKTVYSYFEKFPGLDSSNYYNSGFNNMPIPLSANVGYSREDIIIYDDDGYEKFRNFLLKRGIKNILLCGYATDLCYKETTAGYEKLRKDFNVFLVGDATLASFPAQKKPAKATTAALAKASIDNLITQVSWINIIR